MEEIAYDVFHPDHHDEITPQSYTKSRFQGRTGRG
jgi:hypothetical protein